MVANVSPSALSYEDTYNTLKYADRAKQIKTTLVRNVLQVDYHMIKYKAIIQELRKEISELKLQVEKNSPKQETFDPSEVDRLCELVRSVYGERGRLRKHMADLDAKEREALLKVCRKERDLNRIDLLSANEGKKVKMATRLEALRCHLTDIQRQKQTVNEYLYSNNESVGRVQGVVNAACRAEAGGSAMQRLLETVTEAKKLEVENAHQWKQTKHLLKYIKNQERESVKTERVLCQALSLVRSQQCLLKSSNVPPSGALQADMDSLTHLADGDKGVAWADQTRISTNDLQDVNVSSFSLTQQQLFDCFLEHSSPRMRGGFPRDSPQQLYPSSLSILTSTCTRGEGSLRGGMTTPSSVHSSMQDLRVRSVTPTSRAGSNGTVTVRASHTISSRASPHRTADSSPSLTVTTDVCISSDMTDGEDNASDSSGVGSLTTTSEPSTSEPSTSEPSQHGHVDYDKLKKKSKLEVSTAVDGRSWQHHQQQASSTAQQQQQRVSNTAQQHKQHASNIAQQLQHASNTAQQQRVSNIAQPQLQHVSNTAQPQLQHVSNTAQLQHVSNTSQPQLQHAPEKPRGPAFDVCKVLPASATPKFQSKPRPVGTPFLSRTLERLDMAGGTDPQPYSMFQPFHSPARRSVSSTHMATPLGPTHMATPTHPQQPALSSKHSISTDSGIGHVTGLPRNHGPLLIPNRPLANGFMVRSSPASSGYYSNSNNRGFNAFEDNFVSPPAQQQGRDHMTTSPGHMTTTAPMKAPIGALQLSSLPSQISARVPATPNPYVRAPGQQLRPPHVYQSITIPGHAHNESSSNQPDKSHASHASSCGSGMKLGSKCTESEKGSCDLNSTFTVAMGVAKTGSSSSSIAPPSGHPAPATIAATTKGTTATTPGPSSRGSAPATGHHVTAIPGPTKGPSTTAEKGTQGLRGGRGIFSRNKSPSKIPSYLKSTKSAESKKVQRLQQNKENVGQPPATSSGLMKPPPTSSGLMKPPPTSSGLMKPPPTSSRLMKPPPTSSGLMKRFNLNRSRDRVNAESSSSAAPIGMSPRFSSAPQLAW